MYEANLPRVLLRLYRVEDVDYGKYKIGDNTAIVPFEHSPPKAGAELVGDSGEVLTAEILLLDNIEGSPAWNS